MISEGGQASVHKELKTVSQIDPAPIQGTAKAAEAPEAVRGRSFRYESERRSVYVKVKGAPCMS
jgi:hypothetical protein